MGSYEYWLQMQLEQARTDNAPQNAVHRRDDGTWSTTDDILPDDVRARYDLKPLPNDRLPATYKITIEVNISSVTPAATGTVTRAGFRSIYNGNYPSVREVTDNAMKAIISDQLNDKRVNGEI